MQEWKSYFHVWLREQETSEVHHLMIFLLFVDHSVASSQSVTLAVFDDVLYSTSLSHNCMHAHCGKGF